MHLVWQPLILIDKRDLPLSQLSLFSNNPLIAFYLCSRQIFIPFKSTQIMILKERLSFLIVVFLLTNIAFSQSEIKVTGKVLDAENALPLSYVNVGIVGTSTGTVSDLNGSFELYLKLPLDSNSTLRFSYVGYSDQTVSLVSLVQKDSNIIQLTPDVVHLTTVEVRPRFFNTKKVGNLKTNTNRVNNFAIAQRKNQNLGAAIGRKFNLKKISYLQKFGFFVKSNNFTETRFRLNFYQLKNGKPADRINAQDIIFTLSEGEKDWIEVDLTPYHLIVNAPIVVAIEWIYHSEKGRFLSLPISMPTFATHYYKFGSQGSWKKFTGMSTPMFLVIEEEAVND